MLQFIFGKPLSGKSYTVIGKIKECTENKKECILIVPEQFSFSSERMLLEMLGDGIALSTQVLSFDRICNEVARVYGGLSGSVLSDCDKIILMNRALIGCREDLTVWKKYVHSLSFSKSVLDAVGEFKINSVSADDIRTAAKNITNSHLSEKLKNLARVYEEYDLLLGEKFCDPADKLTKLYYKLENNKFFKNKTVFIDSFKGFTGSQMKIIERIFSQADDVYITFTDNLCGDGEYGIFSNIRKTVQKIEKVALRYSVTVAEPIVADRNGYENETLNNLEKLISGADFESKNTDNAITICKATDIYDEAEFAARNIKRLIREEGLRFKDFVIVARNGEDYNSAVMSACKKNGVKCFYDSRVPLSSFPVSVAAKAAIASLKLSTDDILKFHKSFFGVLDFSEISLLENYCMLWNINGGIWTEEWDMNPDGFVTEVKADAAERLKVINGLRVKAVTPLLEFKKSFTNNAENMATAIINLFSQCGLKQSMLKMCETLNGDSTFSQEALKQSYSEFVKILESLVRCFGERELSVSEFSEALSIALNTVSVGVIPQTLDAVAFGSAEKIRTLEPKAVFIIGANQGVFPKINADSGIFSTSERSHIIKSGIDIADNSISTVIDEEYLVYKNLCSAKEKLFISYSLSTLSGEAREPSGFVELIRNNLPVNEAEEPDGISEKTHIPETYETAFSKFCRSVNSGECSAKTVREALINSNFAKSCEKINGLLDTRPAKISEDTAKKLYGDTLYMSATKFDTYNRCPFSFFCQYGLKAKRTEPADFNVLQRGTIVHYVLEKTVSEHSHRFPEATQQDVNLWVDGYIADYLDSINGFSTVKNKYTDFLISRISRSLKEVVFHIKEELSQSDFTPCECEFKIGGSSDLKVEFPLEYGKISLNGSIDRLDEYGSFIRIIDYKTSSKTFKLPDILYGLNMQMLIYLYAVIRGRDLSDSSAAAILYQPAKRNINGEELAMNGLIAADGELHGAMERSNEGKYVPKIAFNKNGSVSGKLTSFIEKDAFSEIFDHIEKLMKKCGDEIMNGSIAVSPVDGRELTACKYCDYKSVCKIENKPVFKVPSMSNGKVIESLRKGDANER